VKKSTDGGEHWTELSRATYNNLRSVFFIDRENGWAVGDIGVLIKTTNGGNDWVESKPVFCNYLFDVMFIDKNNGWAGGSGQTLLKTTDGGNSWTKVNINVNSINQVKFFDRDNGYIVTELGIYKTTDNGNQWEKTIAMNGIVAAGFIDKNSGWFLDSYGYAYRTKDGGITWDKVFYCKKAVSIAFCDENNGWILANENNDKLESVIYITTNGGKNWGKSLPIKGLSMNRMIQKDMENVWVLNQYGIVFKYNPKNGTEPLPVVLSSPVNKTVVRNREVNLSWSQAPDSSIYHLQVAKDDNFGNLICDIDIFANGYKMYDLFSSTEYFWRVSYTYKNEITDWSETRSFITSDKIFSDGIFKWQYPYPYGYNLYSISYINSNSAVAVGDEGAIVKTTDKGISWSLIDDYTGNCYNKALFVNENIGFVIGRDGALLRSSDGGNTWTVFRMDIGNLKGIDFIDNQTGWMCDEDGRAMKTTDAGLTWTSQYIGEGLLLSDIHFIDEMRGWVVTMYGVMYYTTDGGINWTVRMPNIDGISTIEFIDNYRGFAMCNDDSFVRTTDGGITWDSIVSLNYYIYGIYDICFVDSLNGWISGCQGASLKTSDGGYNWEDYSTPGDSAFFSVNFFDSLNGIGVGYKGTVAVTTNGGKNWSNSKNSNIYRLNDVFCLNKNTVFAVGDNGGIKTTDGGNSWNKTKSTIGLANIFFLNETLGWADTRGGMFLKTTDGGGSWKSIQNSSCDFNGKIYFKDENNGWVLAEGSLSRSSDGGNTWKHGNITSWTEDFQILNDSIAWAVGKEGKVLKTEDGGNTWSAQDIDTLIDYTRVFFLDTITGWIIDEYGILRKTTDGGKTWRVLNNFTCIYQVYFFDENNGWGRSGNSVIQSTDGGENWFVVDGRNAIDFSFADSSNGWFINSFGIFKYTGEGTVSVEEQPRETVAPSVLSVSPNPAMEFINVKFDSGNGSDCEVTICNLEGIALYRERVLQAGLYMRKIDISSLPRGVYFLSVRQNGNDIVEKFIKQ